MELTMHVEALIPCDLIECVQDDLEDLIGLPLLALFLKSVGRAPVEVLLTLNCGFFEGLYCCCLYRMRDQMNNLLWGSMGIP